VNARILVVVLTGGVHPLVCAPGGGSGGGPGTGGSNVRRAEKEERVTRCLATAMGSVHKSLIVSCVGEAAQQKR